MDGKIYTIDGDDGIVGIYDPKTDTGVAKTGGPFISAAFSSAFVWQGKIYVTGGTSTWPPGPGLSSVYIYDPVADSWSKGEDMPRPRFGHTTLVIDDNVYFVGGTPHEGGVPHSVVDVYDLDSGTWTTGTDIPTPRVVFGSGVVDGKLYIISGLPQGGHFAPVNTVEVYDPTPGTATSVEASGKLATTWGEVKAHN